MHVGWFLPWSLFEVCKNDLNPKTLPLGYTK
jgi:hypothetical protein